jgi:hypothetical protein
MKLIKESTSQIVQKAKEIQTPQLDYIKQISNLH